MLNTQLNIFTVFSSHDKFSAGAYSEPIVSLSVLQKCFYSLTDLLTKKTWIADDDRSRDTLPTDESEVIVTSTVTSTSPKLPIVRHIATLNHLRSVVCSTYKRLPILGTQNPVSLFWMRAILRKVKKWKKNVIITISADIFFTKKSVKTPRMFLPKSRNLISSSPVQIHKYAIIVSRVNPYQLFLCVRVHKRTGGRTDRQTDRRTIH